MNHTFPPSRQGRQFTALAIVLLGLAIPISSFCQEENKPDGDIIQIERPLTAGNAFYEKTTLKYSSDVLAMDENAEKFVENPTSTIEFEADQLIVAITPSGYANELMMRIDKLTSLAADKDSETKTLIKPGTYVHAVAAESGCTFSIDGKELEDEETHQILNDLIGLLEEDPQITREEMLSIGEKHPRKAGERWFLDRAILAKMMSTDDRQVSPSEVSGSALYHGIVEARGAECQRLTYTHAIQISSDHDPNPTRFFRSLTVDLPTDTSLMERSFKLRRWTRFDQRFNNRGMVFQGVRSVVLLLDYHTDIDLVTDEDILAKLREANESHQVKAAEKEAPKKEAPLENKQGSVEQTEPVE